MLRYIYKQRVSPDFASSKHTEEPAKFGECVCFTEFLTEDATSARYIGPVLDKLTRVSLYKICVASRILVTRSLGMISVIDSLDVRDWVTSSSQARTINSLIMGQAFEMLHDSPLIQTLK